MFFFFFFFILPGPGTITWWEECGLMLTTSSSSSSSHHQNPANYNHQARDFAQATPNCVWTDQFDNVANRYGHFSTTGPEIWFQTQHKVDAFTCSVPSPPPPPALPPSSSSQSQS
jgi:hypothetical protein